MNSNPWRLYEYYIPTIIFIITATPILIVSSEYYKRRRPTHPSIQQTDRRYSRIGSSLNNNQWSPK